MPYYSLHVLSSIKKATWHLQEFSSTVICSGTSHISQHESLPPIIQTVAASIYNMCQADGRRQHLSVPAYRTQRMVYADYTA
ncbi:MAG: hypothetical protein IJ647_05430 [Prevotella sp.]|nr:hypothetical protein [Prevotella sp.]